MGVKKIELDKDLGDTLTNASGFTLYTIIKNNIHNGFVTELYFNNVATSSSFLNSSIGVLIDEYGIIEFKKKVIPKNINKVQAALLVEYIAKVI